MAELYSQNAFLNWLQTAFNSLRGRRGTAFDATANVIRARADAQRRLYNQPSQQLSPEFIESQINAARNASTQAQTAQQPPNQGGNPLAQMGQYAQTAMYAPSAINQFRGFFSGNKPSQGIGPGGGILGNPGTSNNPLSSNQGSHGATIDAGLRGSTTRLPGPSNLPGTSPAGPSGAGISSQLPPNARIVQTNPDGSVIYTVPQSGPVQSSGQTLTQGYIPRPGAGGPVTNGAVPGTNSGTLNNPLNDYTVYTTPGGQHIRVLNPSQVSTNTPAGDPNALWLNQNYAGYRFGTVPDGRQAIEIPVNIGDNQIRNVQVILPRGTPISGNLPQVVQTGYPGVYGITYGNQSAYLGQIPQNGLAVDFGKGLNHLARPVEFTPFPQYTDPLQGLPVRSISFDRIRDLTYPSNLSTPSGPQNFITTADGTNIYVPGGVGQPVPSHAVTLPDGRTVFIDPNTGQVTPGGPSPAPPTSPKPPKPGFMQRHGTAIQGAAAAGAAAGASYGFMSAVAAAKENPSAKTILTSLGAWGGMGLAWVALHHVIGTASHVTALASSIGQALGPQFLSFLQFMAGPWGFAITTGIMIALALLKKYGKPVDRDPNQTDAEMSDLLDDVEPLWYERLPNPQVLMLSSLLSLNVGNSLALRGAALPPLPLSPIQLSALRSQVSEKSGRQISSNKDLVGKVMVYDSQDGGPNVAYIIEPGRNGNYTLSMARLDADGYVLGADPEFYPPWFEPMFDSQNRLIGIRQNREASLALNRQNTALNAAQNPNLPPGSRRGLVSNVANPASHPSPGGPGFDDTNLN